MRICHSNVDFKLQRCSSAAASCSSTPTDVHSFKGGTVGEYGVVVVVVVVTNCEETQGVCVGCQSLADILSHSALFKTCTRQSSSPLSAELSQRWITRFLWKKKKILLSGRREILFETWQFGGLSR